jgi:hypothetical protein
MTPIKASLIRPGRKERRFGLALRWAEDDSTPLIEDDTGILLL